MNKNFYYSLLLTRSFFHTFRHVQYRGVPIARAMFYSFHRRTVKRKIGKKGKKWSRNKKKLYRMLVRNDPVRRVRYRRSGRRGKILYSPEASQGLPLSRKSSIICGVGKRDRRKVKARGVPFCVPSSMVPLNRKGHRKVCRQIVKAARGKRVPKVFKSRKFIRWMAREAKSIIRTIDGAHKLYSRYRIKGVVQHSTVHSVGYVLAHMGKQRGIPTINLQYGINDDYQLFSTYTRYYGAWGASHKKRLTQFGVPGKKVLLLGNARFDPIFRKKWMSKKRLARKLRVSSKKWIFVYPEQPLKASKNRKVLKAIIRALSPYRKKVVLIVKPHPRQRRMSLSRRMRKKYRFVKVLRKSKLHLYHLIHGSNGVFVQFSTVGIEAILLNRPVIALAFFKNTSKHEHTYYTASRYITSARGQKKLNRVMRLFMRSKSFRKRMLKKQRLYRKGTYRGKTAARRIRKFIRSKCR